ncbi:hypothetical protein KKA14_17765 [bacterium]|nr:hypothetical protein [bacterium]
MGLDKSRMIKVSREQHFKEKEREYWDHTTLDYRLGILEEMKREIHGSSHEGGVFRSFRKVTIEDKNLRS